MGYRCPGGFRLRQMAGVARYEGPGSIGTSQEGCPFTPAGRDVDHLQGKAGGADPTVMDQVRFPIAGDGEVPGHFGISRVKGGPDGRVCPRRRGRSGRSVLSRHSTVERLIRPSCSSSSGVKAAGFQVLGHQRRQALRTDIVQTLPDDGENLRPVESAPLLRASRSPFMSRMRLFR